MSVTTSVCQAGRDVASRSLSRTQSVSHVSPPFGVWETSCGISSVADSHMPETFSVVGVAYKTRPCSSARLAPRGAPRNEASVTILCWPSSTDETMSQREGRAGFARSIIRARFRSHDAWHSPGCCVPPLCRHETAVSQDPVRWDSKRKGRHITRENEKRGCWWGIGRLTQPAHLDARLGHRRLKEPSFRARRMQPHPGLQRGNHATGWGVPPGPRNERLDGWVVESLVSILPDRKHQNGQVRTQRSDSKQFRERMNCAVRHGYYAVRHRYQKMAWWLDSPGPVGRRGHPQYLCTGSGCSPDSGVDP
ncbi:uncharacterized protein B0H64DRAFT_206473 [Chaetomium fimeti]|uniref:Uncharacterized protein n=1 Tax=Chaetomium fimeti TaxID=1854472 RepID=A0AAE0HAV1_9PEZI|nr:hypothetical protein B0H64DRAFT_206473 [Chaetomium fimeti]